MTIVLEFNGFVRTTVNGHTKKDKYPLCRNEELFAKLSSSKFFTIFDLKVAYFQQMIKLLKSWFLQTWKVRESHGRSWI